LGAPYGIKAVFPLAPVDFNRPNVNNAALNVMLPYCDGDVADLQGVHFYDDARYNVPGDNAPKHYDLPPKCFCYGPPANAKSQTLSQSAPRRMELRNSGGRSLV